MLLVEHPSITAESSVTVTGGVSVSLCNSFRLQFSGDFKLNVANVDNVIVQANAFQNTSFIGHFSHVKNLRFEKDAFLGTRNSQIQILDSYVGLLERMDASMHEIKLQNCRIDAIRAHTFDVVSIKSIILDNCDIDVIEANFTTGKVSTAQLGLSAFD